MRNFHANNAPWWRRLLRSKLMLSINLLLVGFVGWSLAGEVAQGNRVSGDLNDLQKRISEVKGQNQDYSEVLSKLDTPGFVDREARLKLGYQKPGEQVLMLKDNTQTTAIAADATDVSTLSNPQKWWRYFFENK
jgi:cell division protein FtsB